jgi:hypothetical protein
VSVKLLYCEGGPKSPDTRVVRAILVGVTCTVEPVGSKYGFGQKILLSRNARPDSTIAGLRDRDLVRDDSEPTSTLHEWRVESDTVWLGWYWERVEIENYLIDPVVVQHALGHRAPHAEEYRIALQASAETIADYTAARIALSISRVRFSPLDNSWGIERGSDRHKFPDQRGETDCRKGISQVVQQYVQVQVIQESDVLREFDALLPICRPNGNRFKHFLTFFSGKDLLCSMGDTLARFGFRSPFEFRERILSGIENSSEDVWTWIPEWSQLRKLVSASSV